MIPFPHQLKGSYLYGSPGSGKTFIMDLFYDSVEIEHKHRVHFNEFMLDVHNRLHKCEVININIL